MPFPVLLRAALWAAGLGIGVALCTTEDGPCPLPQPCKQGTKCAVPASSLPATLYDALRNIDSYNFYPLGLNDDMAIPPSKPSHENMNFSLMMKASMTSGHYYNVVVFMMLRFFDCKPPPLREWERGHWARRGRWECPEKLPCAGDEADKCKEFANVHAKRRITSCFTFTDDAPPGDCLDLHEVVTKLTGDAYPCDFGNANAQISGKRWTTCAAALGLDNPKLWNDGNILSALSFMFNNNIPAEAVSLGWGQDPASVMLGERPLEGLKGAAVLGFSMGSGKLCKNFKQCEQPGLTNTALAATAIQALQHLMVKDETTHLLLQWETAAAAAALLGLKREDFENEEKDGHYLSKKCTKRLIGQVCIWRVGDLPYKGYPYVSTDDVYDIAKAKLAQLKAKRLVLLAVPDHLPRVYRLSLKQFNRHEQRITVYPALIPYDHNYPISASASLVNLFEGSPFLQGNNFGLFPDNEQCWVRNRQIFRIYEIGAYASGPNRGKGELIFAHLPTEAPRPAHIGAAEARSAAGSPSTNSSSSEPATLITEMSAAQASLRGAK